MWHSVVHVHDIEVVPRMDIGHGHRERQCIVRVAEQLVGANRHAVKRHAGRVSGQLEWSFVAYEMDLVAPLSELQPELRGHNTAAPNRGVAGNAND